MFLLFLVTDLLDVYCPHLCISVSGTHATMLTNDHNYGRLSLGGWCRDYCHWWTLNAWEQIHQKLWNLKAVKLLRSRSYATWKLYSLKANQWILVCGLWSWWFQTSQDIGGWGAICSLYGVQALYAFQVQWKLYIGLQLCLHDVAFWACHNCRFMYVCVCACTSSNCAMHTCLV